jgi:hypothetical protein
MASQDFGHWPEDVVYYGPDCVTRYWIYNNEHNCIAYGKMDEDNPVKEKTKEDK